MADEKPKKKKLPTALKRIIQSEKKQLSNQVFKSRVKTAIRTYEKSLVAKKASEELQKELTLIYKLMDKGVKKGVYKPNKAARFKSRYTAKLQKA